VILDCTLRDGGYYVDWDFDENTVRKYLAAVATAKIDIIEIGFRFLPANKFLGAFAYSTDEYLNSLNLPDGIPISVMINAAELLAYENGIVQSIYQLFTSKRESPVDVVRIATRTKDVESCREIAQTLHDLGYRVFLNLMQVDAVEQYELSRITDHISSWDIVEVLYFADSFGSMEPESVKAIAGTIAHCWSGPLGIHAHDNKGLALYNSIAAHEAGVQYIDSTLCGMGRGAGNAKTEYLLVEMMQRGFGEYFPDALFPLALQEFNKLQHRYQWGPNIYYYLSAIHGIHPTYIQEMLGDERYDTDQILSAINFLKSSRVPFFSFENMLRAAAGIEGDEHGEWSAAGWLNGRDVLILGSGPGTRKYIDGIQRFISRHKPVVFCLNVNEVVPVNMVDAFVACHETRILIESDSYSNLGRPIILPLSRVPASIQEALHDVEILDYGLRIEKESFSIAENGCVLSSPLALTYAISIATAGGATKVFLAGVDGYEPADSRQLEMVDLLHKYEKKTEAIMLEAITPTTFPVYKSSLFSK
jgi:4-hydroxy 2-oxovalerate aldolase